MCPPRPEIFCLEAETSDPEAVERIAAEGWGAGASGLEERESSRGGTSILLYAPSERLQELQQALAVLPGITLTDPVAVEATDWSQAWRQGLEALQVGKFLVVRPSWVEVDLGPGCREVVVDPGQAFGTGAHVSTRLALEWIEFAAREEAAFRADTRVLDVGVGSGILALSALRLGAGRAVGFDLDPLAGASAREAAERNALAGRFEAFVGPISAVAGAPFDWLFANLLKSEMLPIAAEMARATRVGGRAVFSGLLACECDEVRSALARVGFEDARVRTGLDSNGDDWVSLLMLRA